MNEVRGKTVVITGAAGGIGRALSARFGKAGARIALLDKLEGPLAEAASALREQGIPCLTAACDVTSPADCERAVAAVVARFGSLDVLVNNAGITHRSAFVDTDLAVLRAVMEVNFFGSVNCTKAALGALLESRGALVAISSVAGFAPLLDRAGYAASKHALHGFFGTLRAELAPRGVRVTLVCPSFTRTGIDKNALGGAPGTAPVPWSTTGRLSSPEEVAEAVHAAVVRGSRLVIPSMMGKVARHLNHWLPALYERMMVRRMAQAKA